MTELKQGDFFKTPQFTSSGMLIQLTSFYEEQRRSDAIDALQGHRADRSIAEADRLKGVRTTLAHLRSDGFQNAGELEDELKKRMTQVEGDGNDEQADAYYQALEFVRVHKETGKNEPFERWQEEREEKSRQATQEDVARMRAVNQQEAAASSQRDQEAIIDIKEKLGISAESKEQLELIKEVLECGGGDMYMSFPNTDNLRGELGGAGFQMRRDETRRLQVRDVETGSQGTFSNPDAYTYGKQTSGKTLDELLRSHGVNEEFAIFPATEPSYKTVKTQVKQRGLGGLLGKTEIKEERVYAGERPVLHSEAVRDGKQEEAYRLSYRTIDNQNNAQYADYSGRKGQYLYVDIVIPKSVAQRIEAQLQKDPFFMRMLIEKYVTQHMKISESAWNEGVGNQNIPLRPPYEAWEKLNGSKKIYRHQPGVAFDEKKIFAI